MAVVSRPSTAIMTEMVSAGVLAIEGQAAHDPVPESDQQASEGGGP